MWLSHSVFTRGQPERQRGFRLCTSSEVLSNGASPVLSYRVLNDAGSGFSPLVLWWGLAMGPAPKGVKVGKKITKVNSGRVFVEDNGITLRPQHLHLLIHPTLGLVQLGNGETFNEARTLEFTGVSYTWRVGEYDITINRARQRKLSHDRIIKLSDVRKSKVGKS